MLLFFVPGPRVGTPQRTFAKEILSGKCGKSLTYGEVKVHSIESHVIPGLKLQDDDVFYDLGSGTGKIPLQVAMYCVANGIKNVRCVGIELAKQRSDIATKAFGRIGSITLEILKEQISRYYSSISEEIASIESTLERYNVANQATLEKETEKLLPSVDNPMNKTLGSEVGDSNEELSSNDGVSTPKSPPRTPVRGTPKRTPSRTPSKTPSRLLAEITRLTELLDNQEKLNPEKLLKWLHGTQNLVSAIHGDFLVHDFTDATHIFVNNAVFDPQLNQALLAAIAQCPKLKQMSLLREICSRHNSRCVLNKSACGAFSYPPTAGHVHPTWCDKTTIFFYDKVALWPQDATAGGPAVKDGNDAVSQPAFDLPMVPMVQRQNSSTFSNKPSKENSIDGTYNAVEPVVGTKRPVHAIEAPTVSL